MANTIKIQDFTGGWNDAEPTTIADNQLSEAVNVYYDAQGILSTRKGQSNFGNAIAGNVKFKNLYFTTFNDGTRILLGAGSTKMYRYNEGTSDWDEIKTGFTADQKFSFITYKNIIYWTNGVDNFMSYDGTTVTEYAAVPKGKYMVVQNDIIYMAGFSAVADRGLVIYSPANPASVNAGLTPGTYLDEYVNQDEGDITGLFTIGALLLVGKDKGIYTVNVFNSPVSIEPIDFDGNVMAHRSFVNVENDVQFMSKNGTHSLSQRKGSSGVYRAYPLSRNIQRSINRIDDKSTTVAFYYRPTNNVYWSVDEGGTGANDTLYVYSVLASIPGQFKYVFTKYENINANDFVEYVDSSGESHLLFASATSAQVIEMETGYTDNGLEISTRVATKTFDFGSPEAWKTFPNVDVGGLISQNETCTFSLDVDGVLTSKDFSGNIYATGDAAVDGLLGEEGLGREPLAGGALSEDGLAFYPFIQRRPYYVSGRRLRVVLETSSLNSGIKYTKLNVPVIVHDADVFPYASITT